MQTGTLANGTAQGIVTGTTSRTATQAYGRQTSAGRALGPPVRSMPNTVTDRRRYYHQLVQTLVSHLQAHLRGRLDGDRRIAIACRGDSVHSIVCDVLTRAIRAGSLATIRSIGPCDRNRVLFDWVGRPILPDIPAGGVEEHDV